MPEERVFSEQEVTDIIRRAVQITEEGTDKEYVPGVTQSELERIAAEVGVPTDALRRAILQAGERKGKRGLFHLTEEFERVVEGELDPSQFDLIAEGVRSAGRSGTPGATQIGRKLTISAWTGVGQARVDVTSRNGRTQLKVKSNALIQMLMTLHPALMISIATVASMSENGMGLLGTGIGLGVMSIGAAAFTWLTKWGHRKAETLADDLKVRIEETVAAQAQTDSASQKDVEIQQQLRG